MDRNTVRRIDTGDILKTGGIKDCHISSIIYVSDHSLVHAKYLPCPRGRPTSPEVLEYLYYWSYLTCN